MAFALIDPRRNSLVIEISGRDFPVAPPLMWVETILPNVVPGWRWTGFVFEAPVPSAPEPLAPSRTDRLIAALVDKGVLTEAEAPPFVREISAEGMMTRALRFVGLR